MGFALAFILVVGLVEVFISLPDFLRAYFNSKFIDEYPDMMRDLGDMDNEQRVHADSDSGPITRT